MIDVIDIFIGVAAALLTLQMLCLLEDMSRERMFAVSITALVLTATVAGRLYLEGKL